MKSNLKKKLAPYTIKTTTSQLEAEGKIQIKAALKNVGLDGEEMLGNNASEIPNYPDDDPMDLATDKFLDEFQRGEH